MSSMDFLLNYWNLNIFALIIGIVLSSFHIITNKFRFTKKSINFFSGVFILIVMYSSPLDYLANNYLFSAHMIEHIISLLVIPPLLLTGTNKAYLKKVFERDIVRKIGKYIFNPVFAWFLGVGSMWFWHIPYFFSLMQNYPLIHFAEMSSLIIIGIIFYWPVFSPINYKKMDPVRSAVYLFSACVGCTILGIFITFAPAGLYTSYYTGGNFVCGFNLLSGHSSLLYNTFFSSSNPALSSLIQNSWGISSSVDQQMAGLIMWVPACIVYVINVMIVLLKWYSQPETDKEQEQKLLFPQK